MEPEHRRHALKMWQMQMGREKSNVTNVYGNRENQLSPQQMDELLKWLCSTGIYYPQQLPAEATAAHIPSLLGPRKHIELPQRQLYMQYAWAKHVIYLPALMLIALTYYHYSKHKTCNKNTNQNKTINVFFAKVNLSGSVWKEMVHRC